MGAPNAESVRINCKISRTEYRIRGLRPDGRPRFPYSFTTGAYVVVDDSDNPVAIHSDMKILGRWTGFAVDSHESYLPS